jgi:hypothetical protein
MASTWLNQERWSHEAPTPPPTAIVEPAREGKLAYLIGRPNRFLDAFPMPEDTRRPTPAAPSLDAPRDEAPRYPVYEGEMVQ